MQSANWISQDVAGGRCLSIKSSLVRTTARTPVVALQFSDRSAAAEPAAVMDVEVSSPCESLAEAVSAAKPPAPIFASGYLFRFKYEGHLSEVFMVLGPCSRSNRPRNPRGPAWWVETVHSSHAGFYVVNPTGGRPGRSECVDSTIIAQGVEVTTNGEPVRP